MMKRIQLFCTSLLLIGLFSLLGIQKANATHVMGSDITYRCISPGKFEVTVKMYRDCRGVSMSGINLTVKSSAGTATVGMTRVSIKDVTPVCAKVQNPCNPSNTYGTGKGIEEHTFVGTLNFNLSPFNTSAWQNACEVTMGFGQCCRNGAITTGQSNANFYAEAMMNKCQTNCNNAPKLTNPPIAFVCCTQPFFFNNGASDTADYDSLSYKLVAPLQNANSNISYGTSNLCGKPFSASMPMTPFLLNPCGPHVPKPNLDPPQGFYLDPITGDIIFTPNECNEVGVVVIKVTEWRKDSANKYQIVGETRRDIQMWVENCPANNPPKINGPYSYSVCPGDQLCFNITTKDDPVIPPPPAVTPPPDTVTLSWNSGIPGASFTITNPTARLKTGKFCWTPGENQVSSLPYTFTSTARDDACPINASATRGFSVLVKERAKASRTFTPLVCGKYKLESVPNKSYAAVSYEWAIRDSFDADPPFFYGNKKIDSFQFTKGGKYIITHTINYAGNCPSTYKDTIVVPPLLEVQFALEDTFLCEGYDLELKATVTNGLAPFKYLWTTGNPNDTTNTYTISIPQDTILDTLVHILVTDGNGCTAFDSSRIFKKPVPRVDIGPDRRICDYDSIHIGLILDTFNTKFVPEPYTYSWNTGNPNDSLDSIVLKTAGVYILEMVDSLGCPGYDTMELKVNNHVTADAGPDVTICAKDTVFIIATEGQVFRWLDITNNQFIGDKDTIKKYMTTPSGQKVEQDWEVTVSVTEDTVTCYDVDTTHIKVNPLPVISINKPLLTEQCYGEPDINLNAFGTTPTGGNWYYHPNQSLITGTTLKGNQASGNKFKTVNLPVTYVYTDNNGCRDSAASIVRINELPPVEVKDTIYCDNAGIQPLIAHVIKPGNPNIGDQRWTALTSPDPVINTAGGVPYKFDPKKGLRGLNNPNKLEYRFENILTGCFAKDTAIIKVIPVPEITFGTPPELCANEPLQNLSQLTSVQPTGGKWVCVNCNGFNPIANDSVTFDPSENGVYSSFTYQLQYRHTATGCLAADIVNVRVNGIPKVKAGTTDDNVCEDEPQVILTADPAGGAWSGAGSSPNLNLFFPSAAGVKKDANNWIYYTYQNTATGCQNWDSTFIYVQKSPELNIITAEPYAICEGDTFDLELEYDFAPPGIQWSTSDGNIANISLDPFRRQIKYVPDVSDIERGVVNMHAETMPYGVCDVAEDDIVLNILEIPNAILDVDSGCEVWQASITATLDNRDLKENQVSYSWDFGDGETAQGQINAVIHEYVGSGDRTVTVIVNNQNLCYDTTSAVVRIFEKPDADFSVIPNDLTTTLAIPEFTFINTTTGGAKPYTNTWEWGDNSADDVNPEDPATRRVTHVYTIDNVGDSGNTYKVILRVETAEGCVGDHEVIVRINPDITIYVPNAFAPEPLIGKQINNYFFPIGQGYTDGEFSVFNRWGEKLYETTFVKGDLDPATTRYTEIGWNGTYANGTPAPLGVYVYVIKARSFSGEEFTYTGSFTLLR